MSLELAAKHLASKGRGPDTMLVHMAPSEVAGLRALAHAHGGKITTNPDTGLPEAGFLRAILPTLIGAGLAPFTGGLSAALLVGGGYGLATGSLVKGITAGLGAYGGAGLAEGLGALGAGKGAAELTAANSSAASALGEGANAKDLLMARGADVAASPAMQSLSSAPATAGYDAMASGAQQTLNNPSALANQMGGWGNVAKSGLQAAAPVISDMMTPQMAEYKGSGPSPYNFSFSQNRYSPSPSPDPYGREQRYFDPIWERRDPTTGRAMAEGGTTTPMPDPQGIEQRYAVPQLRGSIPNEISPDDFEGPTFKRMLAYARAKGAQSPVDFALEQPGAMQMRGVQGMAAGGISSLGGYSDGGRLLRGPGDGVSDDIPAVIADRQPARLADGEFVVPARIVSELGNGSTDAGARKLYAMMDRVQKARNKTVGKSKVAVNSRADKALPA